MENTGKRRNCLLRAVSPLTTVFSEDLYCLQVKGRLVQIERICWWLMKFGSIGNFSLWQSRKYRGKREKMLVTSIFSSSVFGENPRYCFSLSVVVDLQNLWHIYLSNISVIIEDIYLKLGICVHYPNCNPILSREIIQNAFLFSELCPFFYIDFLAAWAQSARWAIVITRRPSLSIRPYVVCPQSSC